MRAGSDSAVKIGQAEFFVRAMRVVVVQSPAEEERVDPRLYGRLRFLECVKTYKPTSASTPAHIPWITSANAGVRHFGCTRAIRSKKTPSCAMA